MKALVCEMCGVADMVKQDGMFVCKYCGCKYTVEEAKKMMIEGTVQIDHSPMVGNYLNLAENAYNTGNNSEAETYCNKVIEIDNENYNAWFLKGRASGWQTTLAHNRFPESVGCFTNALAFCPAEQKNKLAEQCINEITALGQSLISLRGDHFIKFPDNEETVGFANDITTVYRTIIDFYKSSGITTDVDDLSKKMAKTVEKKVSTAWSSKIRKDYESDNGGCPDKYEFARLIERSVNCVKLLEMAINLTHSDRYDDLSRCELIIEIDKYMINAVAYEGRYVQIGSKREMRYFVCEVLSTGEKQRRLNRISNYEFKIAEFKKEKYTKFWTKFANEKKLLTAAMTDLENKKALFIKKSTGHTQVKIIEEVLPKIKDALECERVYDKNPRLTSDDKSIIMRIKNINSELEKQVHYDSYLDKYPLLKEKESLEKEKKSCEEIIKRNNDNKLGYKTFIVIGFFLALGIFEIAIGPITSGELGFIGVVGILCTFVFSLILIGTLYGIIRSTVELSNCKARLEIINKKLEQIKQIPKYNLFINSKDTDQ